MEWVVKASRLCNLRCRYCYEWDHLADRQQLTLADWEKLFFLAIEVAETQAENEDAPATLRFVWHGGEATLLGLAYFREVLKLQRSILADHADRVRNLIQTNLYAFDEPLISYLIDNGFTFGISYDGVPGVRLNAGGRETDKRVLNNTERLRVMGGRYAFIVVVGGHNVHQLDSIYDWAVVHGHKLRLLPLFPGPEARPMRGINLQDTTIADALFELFKRWFDAGGEVDILPFERFLTTTMHHRLGLPRPRTESFTSAIVVTPDGRLYPPWADSDTDSAMGRLGQSWSSLQSTASFRNASQTVTDARHEVCESCRYASACDTTPLTAVPGFSANPRCSLEAPMLERIDTWLEAIGADELV